MRVIHEERDRFAVDIRGHRVVVDQPLADGGGDAGPTPTELFVAGLAACVGHYARRFLARHDLPSEGLEVSASFTMGAKPPRIESVDVVLHPPADVPAERLPALLAVASHCTVHNSLTRPPAVRVELADRETSVRRAAS
jgi:uncharacterized OsmC-like protein